jgi:hypothetical protein
MVDTQWICETRPVCRCSGEKPGDPLTGYSCDCVRSMAVMGCCRACLQPMVEIETDSGRKVAS